MTSSRMTQNLFGAGFLSPTGPSKAFDASADGYCRGEGAGLVVLKPMKDAIRSGDFILGVITGSAVNQGSNCSSITVPDSQSQRSLYHKALAVSGTAPMDVSYVEAHGTGTQVGDPIEFKSIRETFGSPDRKDEVFVGSVKDNIGHIEASSGVAGLLKTLLMMQKHTIPKQANFTRLNPKIEPLGKDRVLIPTQSTDWKAAKRIALINNYGASGNNAAMVVEEATPESCAHDSTLLPQSSHFPFFISGKTIEQVQSYGECLKSFLGKETTTSLADIAYNLAIKQNRDFDNSVVFTSSSISDLKAQLEQAASDNTKLLKITKHKSSVVLCFGGQNGALAQISKDLYDNCILLKHYIDECDVVCTEVLSLPSLFPLVFDTEPIEDITTLHCILFSIQYACAKAWLDCGLRVERMIGHSFGQLTALCVADSLSLADALRLVSTRSRLLDQYCSSEKGLMLVVEGEDSKQLLQLAQQQCQNFAADIACYNGPRSIVVAGTEESIASIENVSQRLPNSFRLIRLSNSHAYHSRLLDGILPGLTEAASTLDFATPKIPIEACSNEDDWSVITAEKITRHSRWAVYFMDAVRRVEQQVSKPVIWLEAGSGSPIIPMVKRAVNSTSSNHHVYIATPLQTSDAQLKLAKATSQLWSNGVRAQFWPFHRTQRSWYNWVNLPPYQFAKTSHWLEYKPAPAVQEKRTIEAEPPSSDLIQHLPSETRQGEAVFEINPRHEIYQLGTEGHKVVDLCLVPASLYTEFVISASRILISTQTAAAPCIRNLEMSSPLGLNPTGRVFLRLVEDKSKAEAWDFSVFSQDQQAGNAHPVIHATGHLAHSSDTSTLAHFDSLKGIILGRCHDIESSPSSIGFKGPTVYQAMHRVVIYADFYHGIRSIYTMGKEAVAYITLPPLRPSNMGSNFCDQVLADSFNQVSGVLANCFSGYGEGEMLICNSMGEIKFTPKFVENGRKDWTWIVYSKYHWTSPKRLSCDTFIFEQDSGELVSIVMATEFQKVSTKSLTKILSRLNATKPSQNAPRYNPAHTEMDPSIYQIQPPAVQQPQIKEHEPIKTTVTANDYQESIQEIKKVLGHILEIPLTEIAPDSVLEDLGIDSLLVTEIFAEMNTRFKISTTQSDVANITDVRGLAELLTPNMISTPRQPSIPASVPVQTVACSTPIITQQYNSNIHGSKQPNMREELPNGLSESSNESGTLQKVKNMLRDILEISLDEIMPESGLEELGIDSLLITEIFAEIKERFNVSVAQADFVAITDVQGLAQLVSSRLNAGSTATATPIFTPQFSASSGPMEMETIVYGERDGVLLSAEIHYPSEVRSIQNAHPVGS
jgi:acyl transferase domain-containing protein/acyl carrier protein